METGTVKWFNEKKGFGFIIPDGDAGDVFMHVTALSAGQLVDTGDKVEFQMETTKKGMRASQVRKVQ